MLFSAIVSNTASVKLHLKIISTFILLDSFVNRYSKHLFNERSLHIWGLVRDIEHLDGFCVGFSFHLQVCQPFTSVARSNAVNI